VNHVSRITLVADNQILILIVLYPAFAGHVFTAAGAAFASAHGDDRSQQDEQ
jgi:hypothetical protein